MFNHLIQLLAQESYIEFCSWSFKVSYCLQNIANCSPNDTASHFMWLEPSAKPPWEPNLTNFMSYTTFFLPFWKIQNLLIPSIEKSRISISKNLLQPTIMEWRAKWMQLQDSLVSSVLVSWNAFRDTFHRSNLQILFTHIKLLITLNASYWIPTAQPQRFPLTRIWLKIQFLGTDTASLALPFPSLQMIIMPSKCVKLLDKQHSVTSQKTQIFIPVFITVKIMGKSK